MGFAALPNQLHRKSVKKGFDFTLMVAGLGGFWRGDWWWVLKRPWLSSHLTSGPILSTGESGLGKSTLINSLFLTNLYEDRQLPEASGKILPILSRRSAHLLYPQATLFLSTWISHDFLEGLRQLTALL